MTGEPPERRLPRREIERLVALARPDLRVREARLAPDGVTPVYYLGVATPEGAREVVLKAAREDDHLGVGAVDAEAGFRALVDGLVG